VNPEIPVIGAGVVAMGGVALIALAIQALRPPSGQHRIRPHGERVPKTVAPEAVVPYAGFHDGPLTVVAIERYRWCADCSARRVIARHADGSYRCGDGHHTPAGGQ
jgi:ribosomal protein S27AE